MHLPRRLLLILSTFAAITAAGVGWYIVQRSAPDAALLRLYVDIGLIATLILIVIGTTGARPHLITDLTEALRALSRGSHDARLDPAEFGALEEVARAYNEAAASLSEMDDPNLGPVKSSKRLRPAAKDISEATDPGGADEEKRVYAQAPRVDANGDHLSDHPELGDVRPIGSRASKPSPDLSSERENQRAPAADLSPPESAATPTPPETAAKPKSKSKSKGRKAKQKKAAKAKSTSSESGAPTVGPVSPKPDVKPAVADEDAPTILEPASASLGARDLTTESEVATAASAETPEAKQEAAAPVERSREDASDAKNANTDAGDGPLLPSRADLRALFDDFVAKKIGCDEDVDDLEFDAFAETLEDEGRRLVSDHACRGIRFEITMESGEVSLLPHLLR